MPLAAPGTAFAPDLGDRMVVTACVRYRYEQAAARAGYVAVKFDTEGTRTAWKQSIYRNGASIDLPGAVVG